MKNFITLSLFIAISSLLFQSCSQEFLEDCKQIISKVRVEPPKGCSENEFLKD